MFKLYKFATGLDVALVVLLLCLTNFLISFVS